MNSEHSSPPVKNPTQEQKKFCQLVEKGLNIGVESGPGTGKTTTCLMAIDLLSASGKSGHLVSYNRAIADKSAEILKGKRGISVSTVHSFALRQALRNNLVDGDRINFLNVREIVEFLEITGTTHIFKGIEQIFIGAGIKYPKENFRLSPYEIAGLAKTTLDNFFQSSDLEPLLGHVDISSVEDKINSAILLAGRDSFPTIVLPLLSLSTHNHEILSLKKTILSHTREIWKDLSLRDGKLHMPHDGYLKLYVNSLAQNPDFLPPGDYFVFDEFQDARPTILSLVEQIVASGRQVIAVGDPRQHIYGYLGNKNGFEQLKFDAMTKLTKSFRFGPEIAEVLQNYVRTVMNEKEYILEGNPVVPSGIDNAFPHYDVILCRTNAGVLGKAIEQVDQNKTANSSIYVPRAQDILALANDIYALQSGSPAKGPLKGCHNMRDLDAHMTSSDGKVLEKTVKTILGISKKDFTAIIDRISKKEGAKTTIMTAHTAKGLEFGYVQVYGKDFVGVRRKVEQGETSDASNGLTGNLALKMEDNIMFVALSRAIHGLDAHDAKSYVPLPPATNGRVAQDLKKRLSRLQNAEKQKSQGKKNPKNHTNAEKKVHKDLPKTFKTQPLPFSGDFSRLAGDRD